MEERNGNFKALIPFIVFAVFYLGFSLYSGDFYCVPMPIAFLVASATALVLDRKKKLMDKVDIYAKGMGDVNIMIMCLIFILAGAFASVAKGMGAVDSAVLIARNLIPDRLLLAGLFFVSCFISLAIGTSCGTIAALTPIAVGLVKPMGISPELMLGTVIGGAMFGDNMSMISDTTIAATRTQCVAMRDKFIANLLMVLPVALVVLVIYIIIGRSSCGTDAVAAIKWLDIVRILPYISILVFALLGVNVMALLFFATVFATLIGLCSGSFPLAKAFGLMGQGMIGMSETLIVAILAGGLLGIIRYNGGIKYMLSNIEKRIRTKKQCEFGIAFLVAIVNLFTANNTVAIVIAGPIAKELSDKYGCNGRRIASILDTVSCVVQGLIPYGAQILIASGIAKTAGLQVSSLGLIGHLYYPLFLGVCVLLAILFKREKKNNVIC